MLEFFTEATALAALAVLIVQQILKLKIIPLAFANEYPVPTNILLSIIASIIAALNSGLGNAINHWYDWLIIVALVATTAAIVYNQLISRWSELKEMEGPGKKR